MSDPSANELTEKTIYLLDNGNSVVRILTEDLIAVDENELEDNISDFFKTAEVKLKFLLFSKYFIFIFIEITILW